MTEAEHYSREFIFFHNGQFDAFVELTFVPGSEAYKKFGRILLGSFIYTRDERNEMEKSIKENPIKESHGYIKFSPSDIPKELATNLKEDLDKKGILNTDIDCIRSLNTARTNRYTTEGEKQIQNQIMIEFDPGELSTDQLHLGNLKMRVQQGYPLIKEEWEQFNGLELYHYPVAWDKTLASGIVPTQLDNNEVRYYHLDTKYLHDDLNEEEVKEYEALLTIRSRSRVGILMNELKKSHENVRDLGTRYGEELKQAIRMAILFDTEVIVPYKFPIWWNLERFLHIYLRHVKETFIGDRFIGRSLFRYQFKDVRRIVSAVIKMEYNNIEEHFKNGRTSNFRRQGTRAVYYDGVYYRFEIASSGLIMAFHPEEDRSFESKD